ncbi:MAG TPA: HlyD family efflux transporter periplasmic adaptor subunit [Aquabacterium sp.]|uniref:efflux RND transporter periplasmic adaptor subunit n=1 Tax=Aquabacterium sp. TaxID=1872578 RepID=UPI002E367913|nr:HlyD family efflux transporter periplasmic adaptor subunit [Aquabacterium sp.]HEX5372193.1 HlyD family efflux transporter periplasmic adaptor subunit [Aquabacterium sp.]
MSTVVTSRPKEAEARSASPVAPPVMSPGQVKPPVADAPSESQAVACLQAFLAEKDWTAGTAAFVTLLNQQLKCHRVALGWVSGQSLRLRVLSDGVLLDEGVALPELHQAMLEAAHQQQTLSWPLAADSKHDQSKAITMAHQTLCRVQGLSGVVTVPLAQDGVVLGAMTLERTTQVDPLRPLSYEQQQASKGFSDEDLRWIGHLAELMSPALSLRYRLEQPWYERGRGWMESLRLRLADPRERALRWSVLAFFGIMSFGIGLPLPYQVTASARLEGAVQRVMSAPQDGFLREVHVHAGDVVKAGQVLAEIADDDLQNALRARVAEANQHENAFAEAFARGDRAQAVIAQSKLSETRAQMALLEQQIARLKITSPFDGVVIAGDLRQQLGAPLKRGDNMLTLAPGLDWRVVLEIDETDIASLNKGQMARLRLAAMPDQTIGLMLNRVTPVAKTTPNGVRYEIEAIPTGAGAGARGLRPGLQGVARIDMPPRPLLWRMADRAWQWLRMQAWTLL